MANSGNRVTDIITAELRSEEARLLSHISVLRRSLRIVRKRRNEQERLFVLYAFGRLEHSRLAPGRLPAIREREALLRNLTAQILTDLTESYRLLGACRLRLTERHKLLKIMLSGSQ